MPTTRFQPLPPAALALFVAALLAGCGGGGDGEPSTEPSALVITEDNAAVVAAEALQANATATAAGSSITAMVVAVPQESMVMMGTVSIDEMRLCYYGGRFYIRGSVASTEAVTVGDKVTVTAEGCRMSSFYAVNGGLGFTVLEGGLTSELVYPYGVTVQVDALNLSLDESGYVHTLAGDTRVAASVPDGANRSIVLSGASLRYSTPAYSYTLKNYSQTIKNSNGATYGATTATLVTSNPMLGASATYGVTTPAELVFDAAGNLVAGTMKVVSGSATLLARVKAVNVVSIQVDTNGDGVYDQTQTMTVDELRALL